MPLPEAGGPRMATTREGVDIGEAKSPLLCVIEGKSVSLAITGEDTVVDGSLLQRPRRPRGSVNGDPAWGRRGCARRPGHDADRPSASGCRSSSSSRSIGGTASAAASSSRGTSC